MSNRAWVTLATNDSYGLGALVLAHSLRRAGSLYPAVVLITPSVTEAMRERLRAVFAEVITVDVLDSRDAAHLALLQRPELGITFTKIHCWSLTQYEKCVFLDADTLVIQNCDELFEREELSAAPDVGWPDCFNSGVFVYSPSNETFERLITFAQERGSFDGGDQGLLNSFFSDWAHGDINKHLPFLYNVTSAAFYSYLPALKHYGQNLKIIHFIGLAKPWLQQFNWESRTVEAPDHLRGLLQLWWDLFVGQVHPQLDVTMGEVQPPPELPPHDVSQHYMPTVDPESEFPWHHPDAQIQEDSQRADIDLGEFHDPWDIYKGQIPSNQEEQSSHHTFYGRAEDHEEMKKYAWEFVPQDTPQHNYKEQTHQQFDNRQHDNWNHHHHHHQPDHHWQSHSHSHDQSAHTQQNQSHEHWQHEQYHGDHSHHDQYFDHQHYVNKQEYSDHGQAYHVDHDNHSSYTAQHQSQDHSHHSHHDHSHKHSEHTPQNYYTDITSEKSSHRVEIVHHVRLDHETILSLHKQKEDPDKPSKANEMMNGDISDNESDYFEEIRPRHPYDGFYLRHKPTIDSCGRKICTHEMPPTPSPSPPLDLESDDGSPESLPEGTSTVTDDSEEQSGVAGNLARVVPGALGSQRDALDELTRRQGWESGNIDYMGADSFDNIWAKISQTLSQSSAPKQPSPPKEQPKQEAPVEVAQEAAPVEAPVSAPAPVAQAPPAQAPGEAPAAAAPAPTDAVPVAVAEVKPPAPVEAPAAKVVETTPAPQSEPVAAADIPASVEAAAAPEAPKAEPAVEPSEIPVTVEAIAPGEAPQPADVPASVEAAAVLVKDEPKIETALPPTPPVTPKSTPETTPVSESAPVLEPVEVQRVEASAPVEAPVVPTPVEAAEVTPVVASEVEKEEIPVPVETAKEPKPVVESQKEAVEALQESVPAAVTPASPAPATEVPVLKSASTPEKSSEAPTLLSSTDSPPLANTPSKEEAPALPASKSEERRKAVGKLQLSPPGVADPLPTPDSELEDAAALAQSIIASELRAIVSSPSPAPQATPPPPAQEARLSVEAPEVPTPPVGAVSLEQIGVKPKAKPSTAAQIESSVSEKSEPAAEAPKDAPKKKVVKKVKKESAAAGGEAPVPPPRKKEKKPKEK